MTISAGHYQAPRWRKKRKPGRVRCLSCGKPWDSPDVTRTRICDGCKRSEVVPLGRIYRVRL